MTNIDENSGTYTSTDVNVNSNNPDVHSNCSFGTKYVQVDINKLASAFDKVFKPSLMGKKDMKNYLKIFELICKELGL